MSCKFINDRYILANGHEIPCLGFGTYKIPKENAEECVFNALKIGYRHIDEAAFYKNEKEAGRGIMRAFDELGLKREDIFVTSKVWPSERSPEKAKASVLKSLDDLRLNYLDLILIHWPADAHEHPDDWEELNLAEWEAFTELYREGKVKAIGVSNFWPRHLKALLKSEVKPMLNQLEIHPCYMQKEVCEFCHENGIAVEAWSPLGRGRVLDDPVLVEIAERHGKSTAQVCLRWCLQHDIIPIVKSVSFDRIEENSKVFDFELSEEEMDEIDAIPYDGFDNHTPDNINYG